MQGAELAAAYLMDERGPPGGDEFGGWVFVAGEAGSREKSFKEGKDIGHFVSAI
jgi:hypothetical protein